MKFWQNNKLILIILAILYCFVAIEPALADGAFQQAAGKTKDNFKNIKTIIFIFGGFLMVIIPIAIFVLTLIKGTKGNNKYGPEPIGNDSHLIWIVLGALLPTILGFAVGAIAGYSKAMEKYKINQTLNQITMVTANIRTLFNSAENYADLNNEMINRASLLPQEMYGADGYVNNCGGRVVIKSSDVYDAGDKKAFIIEYHGLTQEICTALATSDWGANSGVIATMVANYAGYEIDSVTKYKCQQTTNHGFALTCDGKAVSATDAVSACSGENNSYMIKLF